MNAEKIINATIPIAQQRCEHVVGAQNKKINATVPTIEDNTLENDLNKSRSHLRNLIPRTFILLYLSPRRIFHPHAQKVGLQLCPLVLMFDGFANGFQTFCQSRQFERCGIGGSALTHGDVDIPTELDKRENLR